MEFPAWDWLGWCSCCQRSHWFLMGPQTIQGGDDRRLSHLYSAKRWVLPSQGWLCSPCPSPLSQTDAQRWGRSCAVCTPRGQEVGRHSIAGGDLPAAACRAASKDGWVCRAPVTLPNYPLSNKVRLTAKIFFLFLFVMTFLLKIYGSLYAHKT